MTRRVLNGIHARCRWTLGDGREVAVLYVGLFLSLDSATALCNDFCPAPHSTEVLIDKEVDHSLGVDTLYAYSAYTDPIRISPNGDLQLRI